MKKKDTIEKFIVRYFLILDIDVLGAYTKKILSTQLTPTVEQGKLRFVLSWPNGPKDLDIHSFFKISRFSRCEVYFGKRICAGVALDTDNFNGGSSGVETITINSLGKYFYTFAVHKYVDISNGHAEGENRVAGSAATTNSTTNTTDPDVTDVSLALSDAKMSIYAYGFKAPIYILKIPTYIAPATTLDSSKGDAYKYNWWLTFCLNGKEGISSLSVVNKLSINKPSNTYCENFFATASKTSFLETSTQNIGKLKRLK